MPVYCEDCKHCRPGRDILSCFGLDKPTSYLFAKCAVKFKNKQVNTFVTRKPWGRGERDWCSTGNLDGECKEFQPKVEPMHP